MTVLLNLKPSGEKKTNNRPFIFLHVILLVDLGHVFFYPGKQYFFLQQNRFLGGEGAVLSSQIEEPSEEQRCTPSIVARVAYPSIPVVATARAVPTRPSPLLRRVLR